MNSAFIIVAPEFTTIVHMCTTNITHDYSASDTFLAIFAINHELHLSSSLQTVLHISEISLPVYNKFVSSANVMHFIKYETVCMSFTYIINTIGANIEP